jgi:hypothetical protein
MTVVTELENAMARIDALEASAKSAADASAAAHAAVTAERDAAVAALSAEKEVSAKAGEAIAAAAAELKVVQDECAKVKADLELAKSALANPAFAAAAYVGLKMATPEGGSEAENVKPEMTYEQATAAHDAIEGEDAIETARMREAFRAEHAKELRLK